jgi:TolA-binding protein
MQARPRSPRIAPRPTPVEPSVEKPAAPEPLSAQQQFEAATRLERSEPLRAIQLYSGLESGTSSWAANALFAHGRLEAARGNGAVARRILSQYLARFPQGGNAEDARMLLGRLK